MIDFMQNITAMLFSRMVKANIIHTRRKNEKKKKERKRNNESTNSGNEESTIREDIAIVQ